MLDKTAAFPALIIFDWDDTLVDSYPAIHLAINAARRAFALPEWSLHEARENCRIALRESFPLWFGEKWEEASAIFYESFAQNHITMLGLKAGAADILAFLSARQIPLAVNSNKTSSYLQEEMLHLEWAHHFSAVVGANDVARGKPNPEGVEKIRQQCGITADQPVWFIGDNAVDSATAHAGGCLPIIIAADFQPTLHAEVVFKSLIELQDKLQKIS